MPVTARAAFTLGALFCLSLIGAALYFQHIQGLDPCPLCISQRIAVIAAGVVFAAAALHNPAQRGIRIYAVLGSLMSLIGAGIATRHVWLQHLPPDEVPACGPGLDYMFQNFPVLETLKFMLSGTGDCAKIDWTLFGLSMPNWTLFCFVLMAIASALQYWNVEPRERRPMLYRT